MRYIGGKHRLAKHIVREIFDDCLRELNGPVSEVWIEPFVGSGSVIAEVPPSWRRIGYDANPYAIALLKQTQADTSIFPDTLTEEWWKYYRMFYREEGFCVNEGFQTQNALVAFAGWGCSYAARWFEGYARDPRRGTNYAASAKRNLERLQPKIQGVEFATSNYLDLTIPEEYGRVILYCDPPYMGCYHDYYKDAGGTYDTFEFWEWALQVAERGHHVYVSEFGVPPQFANRTRLIWTANRAVSLDKDTGRKTRIDALFKVVP